MSYNSLRAFFHNRNIENNLFSGPIPPELLTIPNFRWNHIFCSRNICASFRTFLFGDFIKQIFLFKIKKKKSLVKVYRVLDPWNLWYQHTEIVGPCYKLCWGILSIIVEFKEFIPVCLNNKEKHGNLVFGHGETFISSLLT